MHSGHFVSNGLVAGFFIALFGRTVSGFALLNRFIGNLSKLSHRPGRTAALGN
jgi:hypothetical protein